MSKFDKYLVKEGHHNFKPNKFKLFTKDMLEIKGHFDGSCLYQFNDIDDYDINKLAGFSTSVHHQLQSIRIGWRPSKLIPGNIELLTYIYDGNSIFNTINDILHGHPIPRKEDKFILSVKPGEIFTVILINNRNNYIIIGWCESNVSQVYIEIPKKDRSFPFKYLLTPYFGGNKKAPHQMELFLGKL